MDVDGAWTGAGQSHCRTCFKPSSFEEGSEADFPTGMRWGTHRGDTAGAAALHPPRTPSRCSSPVGMLDFPSAGDAPAAPQDRGGRSWRGAPPRELGAAASTRDSTGPRPRRRSFVPPLARPRGTKASAARCAGAPASPLRRGPATAATSTGAAAPVPRPRMHLPRRPPPRSTSAHSSAHPRCPCSHCSALVAPPTTHPPNRPPPLPQRRRAAHGAAGPRHWRCSAALRAPLRGRRARIPRLPEELRKRRSRYRAGAPSYWLGDAQRTTLAMINNIRKCIYFPLIDFTWFSPGKREVESPLP